MIDSQEALAMIERFAGQRRGEELIFVLRKHPMTLLMPALLFLFASLMPLVFYLLIISSALPAFRYEPYQSIFFLMLTIYYGFLWVALAMGVTDYYLDVFLVTNKRIMKVEQRGLFNRTVSELELEQIQDVTSVINGPIRTLFGYGDLEVQTASEKAKVEPKDIPHPVTVRRKIMELCTAMDEHGHPIAPSVPSVPDPTPPETEGAILNELK